MYATKQDSLTARRTVVLDDTTEARLARFAEALAPLGANDTPAHPRLRLDIDSRLWLRRAAAAVARSVTVTIVVVVAHVAAIRYFFSAIL